MGGAKVPKQTTTIQETRVPEHVSRAQQQLFGEAQRLYQQPVPQLYPHPWQARLTALPQYQQAAQFQRGIAGGLAPQLGGMQRRALSEMAAGTQGAGYAQPRQIISDLAAAQDVFRNPALQRAVQGAMRQVTQPFQEQIMPAMLAGFAGQPGQNVREDILRQQAGERAARQMADVAAGMYSGAYGQGLEALGRAGTLAQMGFGTGLQGMQAAAGMAPQAIATALAPADIYQQQAQQQQLERQQILDQARRMFEYQQQAPWQQLGQLSSIVGQGTMPSTQQITAPYIGQQPRSPLLGALGGGATGLGLAGALAGTPTMAPMFGATAGMGALGPIGLGLGALLGGLF